MYYAIWFIVGAAMGFIGGFFVGKKNGYKVAELERRLKDTLK